MPTDVRSDGTLRPPVIGIRAQVLRNYARLLRSVVDEVDEAVLVFDAAGDVILSNRAFERLLGPLPYRGYGYQNLQELLEVLGAELDAETLAGLMDPHPRPRVLLNLVEGGTLECRLIPLSVEAHGDHRLMTFREPVAHPELNELRHRAFHDRLTGLPNRELLLDRLEQSLARRAREGGAVGVIFLDLDGFKPINDTHGHATGDEILVEVAARLAREMREVDTVGRLGGDEFVIVCDALPDTRTLELICDRIQHALKVPFVSGEQSFTIGVSIGAVLDWESTTAADALLARADERMYAAKRSGTQIELDDGSSPEAADQRAVLIRSVRSAIDHRQLELVYLPMVSLLDDGVVAVEALLRCSSPELHGVGPAELVQLAEAGDLVHQLTRWVLEEAASAVGSLRTSTGADLGVLVNLSTAQLSHPSLPELITRSAHAAGIEPRLLGFDIAEPVLRSCGRALEPRLQTLVDLGCQLFADDVTGPEMPVELLSELGFSGMKIDGAVISASAETSDTALAVAALVRRAQELGLSAVAEGVADERTLRTARDVGCNGAQGYAFYGIPRPLAQVTQLIG